MEDNKNAAEAENTTEIEAATESVKVAVESDASESKNTAEAKKCGWKKCWKICAIAILALVVVATAIVCIVLAGKTSDPQKTTPETTTIAPEQNNPVVHASISTEQLANYTVISAKSCSDETGKITDRLCQEIREAFGVLVDSKTGNNYNKTQYEILIGDTGREESTTFLSDMKWDDYGYGIVGDKLVIAGKNEDGTIAALYAFIDYINSHKDGEVFFSDADRLLVKKNYPHQSLTINGISASDLSILCNQEELGGIAQTIRDAIIEASGVVLPIVTDQEIDNLEKVILIGDTAHIDVDLAPDEVAYPTGKEYYIDTNHGCAWLRAKTAAGYWSAAVEVTEQLSSAGSDNIVLSDGKRDGEDVIAVMSFNLKAEHEPSAYNARVDAIVNTILKYRPAVVGVQEATDMWVGLLKQRLDGIYTIVGDGRSATKGDEHSAILYLTEEFDLIKTETKWLSDTPDTAGTKFAESHYERIMTYVHLSRKSDGKEFLHINTHLDYGSSSAEEQVKVTQMQVIFDEIAKLNLGDIPTIITGDFNATVGSPVYDKIIAEGYSEAASHISAADRAPTYHALMGTTGESSHIDFIFAKGLANDNLYRICNERMDGENVSDHYPILSVLSFQTEE